MKKLVLTIALITIPAIAAHAEYVKVWDKLNVRADASPTAIILDTLPRKHFVIVQKKNNGWAYIKYVMNQEYRYGWVKEEFLENDIFKVQTSDDPKKLAYFKDLEDLKKRLEIKYKPLEEKQKQLIEQEYNACMEKAKQIAQCHKAAEDCYFNSGLTISECKKRGFNKSLCGDRTSVMLDCSDKRIRAESSIGKARGEEIRNEDILLQQKHDVKFEPIDDGAIRVRILRY